MQNVEFSLAGNPTTIDEEGSLIVTVEGQEREISDRVEKLIVAIHDYALYPAAWGRTDEILSIPTQLTFFDYNPDHQLLVRCQEYTGVDFGTLNEFHGWLKKVGFEEAIHSSYSNMSLWTRQLEKESRQSQTIPATEVSGGAL